MELLARKNGNWYYKYSSVWPEELRGKLVRERPILNGEELEITRKFICYPTHGIIAEIKQYFILKDGEVYRKPRYKEKNFAIIDYADTIEDHIVHNTMKVPPEYIKAVLRDKKPNISGLFEQRDNRIYRTNRTFWGPEFRGTLVGEIECCGLYLW